MAKSPLFIVLEGYLYETMEFEMLRGFEVGFAPHRAVVTDSSIVAHLLDKDKQVVVLSTPAISFPAGCSAAPSMLGSGLLRAVLPRHPDAHQIELRAHGRTIFSAPIGSDPPPAATLKLEPLTHESVIQFQLDPSPSNGDDVQFFLITEAGARLHAAPTVFQGEYSIDLGTYAGRNTGQICVSVSRDFRTNETFSQIFPLPPIEIRGRILEPRNNSEWAAGSTSSLIGNLFDNNGRAVSWDTTKISWAIDTLTVNNTGQIAVFNELLPGTHSIELRYRMPNGNINILDRVEIHVREETAAQKEYAAVIAKYLAIQKKMLPKKPNLDPADGCH